MGNGCGRGCCHAGILAARHPAKPGFTVPTGLQTERSKVAVDVGWGRRVVRVVEWDSVGEAEACLREAFELGSGEATKYNVACWDTPPK